MTKTLSDSAHPFAELTPEVVMDAVESQGHWCDGRNYALNSYENRVYQVGIEEGQPLIAKFYRPQRWSDEQILEEHKHSKTLATALPKSVAPPLIIEHTADNRMTDDSEQTTLFDFAGFKVALYPKIFGQAPDTDNLDQLYAIGQLIGQIHAHNRAPFTSRLNLNPTTYGHAPRAFLLDNGHLPATLKTDYQQVSEQLLKQIENQWQAVDFDTIRLHGDCHLGNILWHEQPTLVDFDDALNGPAVQDIWMMLSGDTAQKQLQLETLLEGYEEYCDFNREEIQLIETLRSLRMVHYSAWLAKRYQEPAFQQAFSWFGSTDYWRQHIKDLQTQLEALNQPVAQHRSGNC